MGKLGSSQVRNHWLRNQISALFYMMKIIRRVIVHCSKQFCPFVQPTYILSIYAGRTGLLVTLSLSGKPITKKVARLLQFPARWTTIKILVSKGIKVLIITVSRSDLFEQTGSSYRRSGSRFDMIRSEWSKFLLSLPKFINIILLKIYCAQNIMWTCGKKVIWSVYIDSSHQILHIFSTWPFL